MSEQYKVKWWRGRNKEESYPIEGPEAFTMAHNLALHWLKTKGGKATILKATTVGPNAGQFFLHQIVQ